MSSHLFNGATNKQTKRHEHPLIASKNKEYACPECNRDVIFCKGKIKRPYFSHKRSDTPCTFYNKSTESQMHREAKRVLHMVLERKQPLQIIRECYNCICDPREFSYKPIYSNTSSAAIEKCFYHNHSNKYADVALCKDSNICAIFEVLHSHKTNEEDRPEPWFEIKASHIIEQINKNISFHEIIRLNCERDWLCSSCSNIHQKMEEKRKEREKEFALQINENHLMGKEDERKYEKIKENEERKKMMHEETLQRRFLKDEKQRKLLQSYLLFEEKERYLRNEARIIELEFALMSCEDLLTKKNALVKKKKYKEKLFDMLFST